MFAFLCDGNPLCEVNFISYVVAMNNHLDTGIHVAGDDNTVCIEF